MTTEEYFPYKEIIDLMKCYYNWFDDIQFETINTLTDYLIEVNVKQDKEFKLLLVEGYYK